MSPTRVYFYILVMTDTYNIVLQFLNLHDVPTFNKKKEKQ